VIEPIAAPAPAAPRKKAVGAKKKKPAAAASGSAAPAKKSSAAKKDTKPKVKKTVAGKVTKAKKDVKKTVNGAAKKAEKKEVFLLPSPLPRSFPSSIRPPFLVLPAVALC
jgi:hypothetical protein